MHYHIIPAPDLNAASKVSPAAAQAESAAVNGVLPSREEMHKREFEAREELDDGEAAGLVERIRARL